MSLCPIKQKSITLIAFRLKAKAEWSLAPQIIFSPLGLILQHETAS